MKKIFVLIICTIFICCSCKMSSVTSNDIQRMKEYAFETICARTYDTSWQMVENEIDEENDEYIIVMQNSKGKKAKFAFQIPLGEVIHCRMMNENGGRLKSSDINDYEQMLLDSFDIQR